MNWVAATVIAPWVMWRGVRLWARFERRVFGPPPVRRSLPGPPAGELRIVLPEGEAGHLEFADELLAAARAYRNECARRAESSQ